MSKRSSRSEVRHESDLVARMLEGDDEAFRMFFSSYSPRLRAFVANRTSLDPASVDDIVQVALVKAMRCLSSYRGDASLFTWLCAIGWRESLTMRRREQKHLGCESLEALLKSRLIDLRAPENCEPDYVSDAESLVEAISTTMNGLPVRYSRALEMKYLDGCAVDELAGALGTTVVGAQSLLARARTAFRLAWAGA